MFSWLDVALEEDAVGEEEVGRLDEVRAAIFFHDIIYDPTAPDNEEKSEELFREFAEGEDSIITPESKERISGYILHTKSHLKTQTDDPLLKLFLDLDLSILGSSRERYAEYTGQVRQEYKHIDDAGFRKGRGGFLQGLTGYEALYFSEFGKRRFEAPARVNIEWEVGQLKEE